MPSTPPAPRPAATVVLFRDGPSTLEVFLQRRVTGMAFAGGMTVFPGGGIDAGDRAPWDRVEWCGPGPQWWAQRFGCSADEAGALVVAAIRETFEECGVLLAGPGAGSGVLDGQEADAHTIEAVEATWWRPRTALEGARRGDLRLLPPTQHTLEEIAAHPDAAAVLRAARVRSIRTYRPRLGRDGGRAVVTVPDDPDLRFDLGPA